MDYIKHSVCVFMHVLEKKKLKKTPRPQPEVLVSQVGKLKKKIQCQSSQRMKKKKKRKPAANIVPRSQTREPGAWCHILPGLCFGFSVEFLFYFERCFPCVSLCSQLYFLCLTLFLAVDCFMCFTCVLFYSPVFSLSLIDFKVSLLLLSAPHVTCQPGLFIQFLYFSWFLTFALALSSVVAIFCSA